VIARAQRSRLKAFRRAIRALWAVRAAPTDTDVPRRFSPAAHLTISAASVVLAYAATARAAPHDAAPSPPPVAVTARGMRVANAATPDPAPLLTYAASHHYPPVFAPSAQHAMEKRLTQITFDLSKDPPPETNCAQTLGAKRFATLFDDLGGVYSSMGDDAKAADAFAKAIGCNPRAEFLHAQLAAALLDMGRYNDARIETQRQLSLGRAHFSVYTLITQLDFIEDRWPEAVTDARLAANEAPDDEQATYWQCFLWIAQRHAGTQEPVLVNRRIPETWPAPILESLQGKITEAELADAVAAENDEHRQREILTEALFYTGQKRLAESHVEAAVKYFTATANLEVPYFIEHHLAMAELEKLHHPMP
jgi:lipoprotein NlpI